MVRGSSRGGSSSSRGSSGRQQSSGHSKQSGRSATAPKGQIKGGKAVQYAIKGKTGETKYIGSTNNPTRRAAQHQQSGKMQPGESLEIQIKPISREQANRLEAGRMSGHRKAHGGNPERNHTNDGQYHK